MTIELGTQEPSAAGNNTTADPPYQSSRFRKLKALGKKIGRAEGKSSVVYKEVVEAALRARADCTAERDIQNLFEEARKDGIVKRLPRRFDVALITPLIIDAVFSEVKDRAGDSTRSRLIRIVDYTLESGSTLDELIAEHKGLWNIYGAWRKDKVDQQVTKIPTTVTIRLVISQALGASIQAGEEAPRLTWSGDKQAFTLEPLPGQIAEEGRGGTGMKSVLVDEVLTSLDATLAVTKSSGLADTTVSHRVGFAPVDGLVDDEESTPEEARLQSATDTYLGRHVKIDSLGGGIPWKQFQEHVTSTAVTIAGKSQRVYKVERVTLELLSLLKLGNAVVVELETDEDKQRSSIAANSSRRG